MYHMEAWAPPGVEIDRFTDRDFGLVIARAHEVRARRRDVTVAFANLDRCDLDTNGLTDAENERLEAEGF